MRESEIAKPVTPELEIEGDFGVDSDQRGLVAQIADQPIAHKMSGVYEACGLKAEDGLIFDRFVAWLVPHRVGILRRSGRAEPTSVGIDIEYLAGGTCSVISMLPAPEFLERGHAAVSIDIRGSVQPAPVPIAAAAAIEVLGMQASASASGSIGLDFSAKVFSPKISAIGVGASRCSWVFHKADEPLHGRDLTTWSVLAVHRSAGELRYKMRIWFTHRVAFFETRVESDWEELNCNVAHVGSQI